MGSIFSLLSEVSLVHGWSSSVQFSLFGSNFGDLMITIGLGVGVGIGVLGGFCEDGDGSKMFEGDVASVGVVFSIIVWLLKVWQLFVGPRRLFCGWGIGWWLMIILLQLVYYVIVVC